MHDMAVVLMVIQRQGIWRVTKDGVFHGDYRQKASAAESAETAAVALRRAGRTVKIVIMPSHAEK